MNRIIYFVVIDQFMVCHFMSRIETAAKDFLTSNNSNPDIKLKIVKSF